MNKSKHTGHTLRLTVMGVMTALATVIYLIFPEIPLVPGMDYFKMDFSDIPAIVTGVALGPVYGVIVEVFKNIIHLTRTTTFGIGELMNIGVGATILFGLSCFSKFFSCMFKKERMAARVYYCAAVCTIACTIISGWALNALFTPAYFYLCGIPVTSASVFAGVWGSTLLNTIKSALNLLPFFPVYLAVFKTFDKISH